MCQIPVDNYTAIYVIRGDDVVVLRVLYSASDINPDCVNEYSAPE